MANTRRALLILGLAMPLLVLAACSSETATPKFNECGWPGDCSPTAGETMGELVGWAKADVQKYRIRAGNMDQLRAHFERIKSVELTNQDDKHVCLLENPDPCSELQIIHDMGRAAHAAANDTQARKLWEECIQALHKFPSGS